VVIYDCITTGEIEENAYELLKLIKVAEGDEQIAAEQLQYCGGVGAFGLEGLFWSPNSQFFFYTNVREGWPGGCGYWERGITRVDVTTFEKAYIGAGPLSPDGEKIATWQAGELVVWHINDGEIMRFPAFADANTGPIAWSPDSQRLVYLQFESYCPLAGRSFVVHIDLREPKQTLVLESENPTFGEVAWNAPDQLALFDEDNQPWVYSFTTDQLMP